MSEVQNSNIVTLFLKAAEEHPDNIAIIHKGRHVTYRQLKEQVLHTASYFNAKGVSPHDRVLVFVPMSIDLYRVVLALFYCGATAVFLDEWVSRKRLNVCCEVASCRAFVAPAKLAILGFFISGIRKIPVRLSLNGSSSPEIPLAQVSSGDAALITFTTGSTGIPKAAIRTHENLAEQFRLLRSKLNASAGDVDITSFPVVLLINLAAGATSVIADFNSKKPEKFNPGKVITAIQQFKASRISASPYFLQRLSEHAFEDKIDLNLDRAFTGGAPVFPSQAEKILRGLKGTDLQIVFGSTEAEPVSGTSASDLVNDHIDVSKGLFVGKVNPDVNVRIIKITDGPLASLAVADLEMLSCPEGHVGEIVVSGKHVVKEYLNNPEAVKLNKIFCEGTTWHRTGDAGMIDEKGDLYLYGRCANIVESNGVKLFPLLYEYYLSKMASVSSGTMMRVRGKICLVIEAKQGGVEDLKKELTNFPFPFDNVIYRKLPRDPRHHSKIDYQLLKKQIG